ncbi:MAG: class B sortase [Erysipelotrichaceae bacterium]|nr:class B sortase [Erysipelotrichaceae bacterium]
MKGDSKTNQWKFRYLLAVLLAVFLFSSFMAAREVLGSIKEQNAFAELSQIVSDASGPQEQQSHADPETKMLPQYIELHEMNQEFFGWISVEGTEIDYPVMYSPERPNYYLHRAFDGSYSFSGVPFVDSHCPYDGNYYLIYGHHMKNRTMFGQLTDYTNHEFYKEHQLIRFDTLFEQREYVVMSVFMTSVDPETKESFLFYQQTELTDADTFDAFVKRVKEFSFYDCGIDAVYGDELIALSTCSDHESDGRFVVVAKRIR